MLGAMLICNQLCREAESATLAKSLLKGSMKKMTAIHFKQELCLELLRCEAILKERISAIIKVQSMVVTCKTRIKVECVPYGHRFRQLSI